MTDQMILNIDQQNTFRSVKLNKWNYDVTYYF